MNPDQLKQAWQTQAAPRRLAADAAPLLNEARRNHEQFKQRVFWRDVREVGVSNPDGPSTPGSTRRAGGWMVLCCAIALSLALPACSKKSRNAGPAQVDTQSGSTAIHPAITNLLGPIREKYNVPAICAAIVTSKSLTSTGIAGVRKRGTDIPATLDDLWHLGSDTKAMTATLVARLVEQGRLKWDTTVTEVFPELAEQFHRDLRGVTILHLLSHRSGLRPNLDLPRFAGDDVRQLRLRAVREELAKAPSHQPGSNYEYSNLGYIITGAMIERVMDKTWEDAIREEVFQPLKMTSAGFGGTGTRGHIDQPWPHRSNGDPMPDNGPAMDNLPVMGPAGRVHCTIQDWAKFIQDQLRGARGEPALLKAASYQKLHTPPFGGEYALGWLVVTRDWGGGTVLNHAGDNTMNCANVWVAPRRDLAILICINQGGASAFKASDEAVGELLKLY